ncbi:hypothetical protein ElyMa_005578900 [Elysia marginata]|uniref:Uncharacterized protein n=1 Tax=Elysia marginata TaxID=1093978 RepID=A0AAV4F3F0_9GAST|nr:hypothetical protein ElyMa_005578900 [Elysia marginata]
MRRTRIITRSRVRPPESTSSLSSQPHLPRDNTDNYNRPLPGYSMCTNSSSSGSHNLNYDRSKQWGEATQLLTSVQHGPKQSSHKRKSRKSVIRPTQHQPILSSNDSSSPRAVASHTAARRRRHGDNNSFFNSSSLCSSGAIVIQKESISVNRKDLSLARENAGPPTSRSRSRSDSKLVRQQQSKSEPLEHKVSIPNISMLLKNGEASELPANKDHIQSSTAREESKYVRHSKSRPLCVEKQTQSSPSPSRATTSCQGNSSSTDNSISICSSHHLNTEAESDILNSDFHRKNNNNVHRHQQQLESHSSLLISSRQFDSPDKIYSIVDFYDKNLCNKVSECDQVFEKSKHSSELTGSIHENTTIHATNRSRHHKSKHSPPSLDRSDLVKNARNTSRFSNQRKAQLNRPQARNLGIGLYFARVLRDTQRSNLSHDTSLDSAGCTLYKCLQNKSKKETKSECPRGGFYCDTSTEDPSEDNTVSDSLYHSSGGFYWDTGTEDPSEDNTFSDSLYHSSGGFYCDTGTEDPSEDCAGSDTIGSFYCDTEDSVKHNNEAEQEQTRVFGDNLTRQHACAEEQVDASKITNEKNNEYTEVFEPLEQRESQPPPDCSHLEFVNLEHVIENIGMLEGEKTNNHVCISKEEGFINTSHPESTSNKDRQEDIAVVPATLPRRKKRRRVRRPRAARGVEGCGVDKDETEAADLDYHQAACISCSSLSSAESSVCCSPACRETFTGTPTAIVAAVAASLSSPERLRICSSPSFTYDPDIANQIPFYFTEPDDYNIEDAADTSVPPSSSLLPTISPLPNFTDEHLRDEEHFPDNGLIIRSKALPVVENDSAENVDEEDSGRSSSCDWDEFDNDSLLLEVAAKCCETSLLSTVLTDISGCRSSSLNALSDTPSSCESSVERQAQAVADDTCSIATVSDDVFSDGATNTSGESLADDLGRFYCLCVGVFRDIFKKYIG